jgi:hypothetical protein
MKTYLLVFFVIITSNSFSQKVSERRKMAEKNNETSAEELFDNDVDSKNKRNVYNIELLSLSNNGPNIIDSYSAYEAPEKYKNNSAVVLAQNIDVCLSGDPNAGSHISGGHNTFRYSGGILKMRRRVLIQDMAALELFSVFYANVGAKYKISLIKKDKSVKMLNNSNQIIDNDYNLNIPAFFTEHIGTNDRYFKLPIPNLEVGDIIDYKIELNWALFSHSSDAYFQFKHPGQFPIVKQQYSFYSDNYWTFNFSGILTEIDLKYIPLKNGHYKHCYTYTDAMQDANKSEKFASFYKVSPGSKAVYNSQKNKLRVLLNRSNDTSNSKYTAEEIIDMVETTNSKSTSLISFFLIKIDFMKFLKNKNANNSDPIELVKHAYYYLRATLPDRIDPVISFKSIDEPNFRSYQFFQLRFIKNMIAALDAYQIPYELLIATPRDLGNLDQMIDYTEVIQGIKILGNKSIYVFPCTQHSNFGEIPDFFEGVEAICYTPKKEFKGIEVIPQSVYSDNYVYEKSIINIAENFKDINLDKSLEVKGLERHNYYSNLITYEDYKPIDEAKYNIKDRTNKHIPEKGARREAYDNELLEIERLRIENRLKDLKTILEDQNFEVSYVKDFEIKEFGRSHESPLFEFNYKTSFKNILNKVGENYFLSIGKIIGQQIALTNDDTARKFDIFQPYCRSYKDEIEFMIPPGFKIEDINMLNVSYVTNSLSFVAKSEIKDNVLKITVTKNFFNLFEKRDNWGNYIKVLNGAYDFYNSKVVLKKI